MRLCNHLLYVWYRRETGLSVFKTFSSTEIQNSLSRHDVSDKWRWIVVLCKSTELLNDMCQYAQLLVAEEMQAVVTYKIKEPIRFHASVYCFGLIDVQCLSGWTGRCFCSENLIVRSGIFVFRIFHNLYITVKDFWGPILQIVRLPWSNY